MKIEVAPRDSHDWKRAMEYIRLKYADKFGAAIQPNPDFAIVCVEREGSAIVAAAGMSFAGERQFFSEIYLPAPVEVLASGFTGRDEARDGVVEIGPLAASDREAALELVRVTPIVAWCQGKTMLLCTVTKQLRRMLAEAGIVFNPFGPAEGALLGNDRSQWGTYYDCEPVTGFISLANLGALFGMATGRYRFTPLRLELGGANESAGAPPPIRAEFQKA